MKNTKHLWMRAVAACQTTSQRKGWSIVSCKLKHRPTPSTLLSTTRRFSSIAATDDSNYGDQDDGDAGLDTSPVPSQQKNNNMFSVSKTDASDMNNRSVSKVATALTSYSDDSLASKRNQRENESGAGGDQKKIPKRWSLQRLLDIQDVSDPKQMAMICHDIALRLDRQQSILGELKSMIQEMKQSKQIQTRKKLQLQQNQNEGKGKVRMISATNRPIWWTLEAEQSINQELDLSLKNMHNLQVLHQDTHRQCYELYTSLKKWDDETSNTSSLYDDNTLSTLFQTQIGKTFQEVYARHALTVETMAELVIGLRPLVQPDGCQDLILKFLQSRITIQLLCDHIVQLQVKCKPHGAISAHTKISDVVQEAITEAKHLCEAHYLTIPPVIIVPGQDNSENKNTAMNAEAMLIRPWLQYSLIELMKNSMSITVERNINTCPCPYSDCTVIVDYNENTSGNDNDGEEEEVLCPIYIQLYETSEEIGIEIFDQGGGLLHEPKEEKNNSNSHDNNDEDEEIDVFAFAQCSKKWDRLQDQQTYAMTRSPVRGLGVGLSLSRMMMTTFGGKLELIDRPMSDLEPGMTAKLVIPKNTEILESVDA